MIRQGSIRSKSTKMVITLLINLKKDVIQGFYANYERLIIGKKVVHIQSIGEVKTSQQLPRNKKPSNPRVTFDGRHWWISVGFQEDFELQELTNESIGVDVGLKELFCSF